MADNIHFENKNSAERKDVVKELVQDVYTPVAGKKLGVALVGLGKYSEGQLGPALLETKHCYLAGIVTGTPEKIPQWKTKYSIPDDNIYNYENFDEIATNKDIDILYIVLPNALHAEYTIRGAKAGKHIICEKPMAVTIQECDQMIKACQEAGILLSIGYRLHFDPYHRDLVKMGQSKVFGDLTYIHAAHSNPTTKGWRIDKKLAGGGPLMDLGIYCIQAAMYASGMQPIAITAKEGSRTNASLFASVEESITWEMEFPNGLMAVCETSYSSEQNIFHADAAHGWFELSPAYSYGGLKGKTATGFIDFPGINQQAFQMDDFANSILTASPVKLTGEMGKMDVQIIEAIYEAARTGKRIELRANDLKTAAH